jgi:hypothetical protein
VGNITNCITKGSIWATWSVFCENALALVVALGAIFCACADISGSVFIALLSCIIAFFQAIFCASAKFAGSAFFALPAVIASCRLALFICRTISSCSAYNTLAGSVALWHAIIINRTCGAIAISYALIVRRVGLCRLKKIFITFYITRASYGSPQHTQTCKLFFCDGRVKKRSFF